MTSSCIVMTPRDFLMDGSIARVLVESSGRGERVGISLKMNSRKRLRLSRYLGELYNWNDACFFVELR